MSLKRIVYRGGGYARRRDRSGYGSPGVTGPAPQTQTTDGCMGVSVMGLMLGGLLVFVFPPLGAMVIFFSLMAGGAAALFGRPTRPPQSIPQPPAPPQPEQRQTGQPTEQPYLYCHCQHCNQRMEFPRHGVGMTINCPTCGLTTLLCDAKGA